MYSRSYIEQNTILLCVAGSRMYNLHTPSSDWDFRGVMVRPAKSYASFQGFEQKDKGWEDEEGIGGIFSQLGKDTVIYDLRKFLTLTHQGQPNQIEYLFAENYLHLTDAGKYLISQRDKFLTSSIKFRFIGYAKSQIQRMETHRKWLLDPPTSPPNRAEFGLDVMGRDEVNALCELLYDSIKHRVEYLEPTEELRTLLFEKIDYKALFKNYPIEEQTIPEVAKTLQLEENIIHRLQRSKQYYSELRKWDNYQQWLKKRNPERAKLEAQLGYDSKPSLHCLRLLFQANHILEYKHLPVNVDKFGETQATFLRDIKAGKVSYEKIKNITNYWFSELYNKATSLLPEPITLEELEDILFETIDRHKYEQERIFLDRWG